MNKLSPNVDDLDRLQRDAVGYFLRAANPDNGLIADSSREGAPCSIAATGLGLSAYVVGVERGFLARRDAARGSRGKHQRLSALSSSRIFVRCLTRRPN